jgi:predicted nucleic acid-binding Zn ribbon protein
MDNLIKTMPAILAAAGASAEAVEAICAAAWKYAVGEALSRHSLPLELREKTMVVAVEDKTWQKQLDPMRGEFLFRLNSLLGRSLVQSIEFRVEPEKFKTTNQSELETEKVRDNPVPFELLSAAAAIDDPGLRRAFLGAAVSCLNRLQDKV